MEFSTVTTWLEHVRLVHQAAPAFDPAEAALSLKFLGRTLRVPFFIGAMTGGTAEARRINRDLAAVAREKGVGLALGSQRPMLESKSAVRSYRVRDVAPDILLLGNIGFAQARSLRRDDALRLVEDIGADGLCLHLNAAMEMFQREGDRSAKGTLAAVGRLARTLGKRLIVKETGCGISRETAQRLRAKGVRTLDVAGAGGTSWVRVENLRNTRAPKALSEFEEWGIPTAASLLEVRGCGVRVIASGGIRTGLDLAKAIALGAEIGSAALPVLRAYTRGGAKGVGEWIDGLAVGLRAAMTLAGCADLKALRRAPIVVRGPLKEWMEQRALESTRRG